MATETSKRQALRRIDPTRALQRDLAIYARQRAALEADAARIQERIDNLKLQLLADDAVRHELDAAEERTHRALAALRGPVLERGVELDCELLTEAVDARNG